jgi:hypothetical protein
VLFTLDRVTHEEEEEKKVVFFPFKKKTIDDRIFND